jgi:hypothetical protein
MRAARIQRQGNGATDEGPSTAPFFVAQGKPTRSQLEITQRRSVAGDTRRMVRDVDVKPGERRRVC